MKRTRWVALVRRPCIGRRSRRLTATAGAQSSEREAQGDRRGDHRHGDPHRGHRRRRQPDRAQPVQGLEGRGRRASAKYLNSKAGGGGLAGRKVVVDFYDSKLNPTRPPTPRSRRARTTSPWSAPRRCSLTSVDNMRNCKDSTGAVTGLPDIPFVTTALVQQCSDQSFPMAPPQVICSTARTSTRRPSSQRRPRRSTTTRSTARKLHGVYIFGSDSKSARDSSFVSGIGAAARRSCMQVRQGLRHLGLRAAVGVHAGHPGDEERRLELRPGNHRPAPMILMRKEATLQGLTGVKVWDCGVGCYDKQFLQRRRLRRRGPVRRHAVPALPQQGGPEGEPDARQLREVHGCRQGGRLRRVRLGGGDRLPRRGERRGQGNGGVNGVTRKTIFAELNKIHKFNADGMFGTDRPRGPQDLAVSRAPCR